jgi:hypothetical protein
MRFSTLSLLPLLLAASCTTKMPPQPKVAAWSGSQVFMLAWPAGFEDETLELRDGRFRYWLDSDVILSNPPRYPIEGTYEFKGDQLILSTGQTYTSRTLQRTQTLWKPSAVSDWNRQIIDAYGILVKVQSIRSEKPRLEDLFTKEQWRRSEQTRFE